jgi:uncharacterized membrane protein
MRKTIYALIALNAFVWGAVSGAIAITAGNPPHCSCAAGECQCNDCANGGCACCHRR